MSEAEVGFDFTLKLSLVVLSEKDCNSVVYKSMFLIDSIP